MEILRYWNILILKKKEIKTLRYHNIEIEYIDIAEQ